MRTDRASAPRLHAARVLFSLGRIVFWWAACSISAILAIWLAAVLFSPRPTTLFKLISDFSQSATSNRHLVAQSIGDGNLTSSAIETAGTSLVGMCIGLVSTILIALATTFVAPLYQAIRPLVSLLRIVPPLILLPLIFVVTSQVGYRSYTIVAIYAFVSLLPIAQDRIYQTNPVHIYIYRHSGGSFIGEVVFVRLRSAVVGLVDPIRLAWAFTLGVTVILEYLGSPDGLGRAMKIGMGYSSLSLIVNAAVCVVVIGALGDLAITISTLPLTRWRKVQLV